MDESKIKISTRIMRMVNTDAYRIVMLIVFVVLFSWPYMSFLGYTDYVAPFTYFFAIWGLLILTLTLGARGEDNNNDIKNND